MFLLARVVVIERGWVPLTIIAATVTTIALLCVSGIKAVQLIIRKLITWF